jgi:L-asparagine transporter-like permease
MLRSSSSQHSVRQQVGTSVSPRETLLRSKNLLLTLPGYTMSISVPAEISAAATLIQFWNDSINPAVWITIFLVFIIAINFCGVRLYGEVSWRRKPICRGSQAHMAYRPKLCLRPSRS